MAQSLRPPPHLVDGHLVTVTPIQGGWCVASTFSDQPLVFFSGEDAEANAKRLAVTLAKSGQDAHVIVRDIRNTQIGTVRYFGVDDEDGRDSAIPADPLAP